MTETELMFITWSNITDARLCGGYVRLASDTGLIWPVSIGHAWEHNCAGLDVFDNYGQVALSVTPEIIVSV